jgi:hypothetical protein
VTQEEAKAARERAVFMEFAAVARLAVVPGSVESRRPREPDILCRIAGVGPVAFELVGLEDEDLTRTVAQNVARPNECRGTWFDDPTLDTIGEKLTERTYVTQHPMELLAYGGDTLDPFDVWQPKCERRLKDLLDGSCFRRLWVVNLGPLAANRPVWLVHPPY